MQERSKKYYEQANESYKLFTPDFLQSQRLDRYLEENNESILNFLEQYQEQFGDFNKEQTILEAGCGLGGVSLHFSKQGFYTLGLDQSALAIQSAKEIAKQKNLFAKFETKDLCSADSSNEKFDIIIDSHLLHCLVDEQDRKSYLSFVKNSLVEGGHFFLETMSYQSKLQIPIGYELSPNFDLYKEVDGQMIKYRKLIESIKLEQELTQMGFKIKYLYYHNELSFDVFPDYKDYSFEYLPRTIRLAASK